jgi:hypothetical protein
MATVADSLQGFRNSSDINGLFSGVTDLYDPADHSNGFLVPVMVSFETKTVTSVTATAIVSVGTDSPNYDDLIPCHKISLIAGRVDNMVIPISKKTTSKVRLNVFSAGSGTTLSFVARVIGPFNT